MMMMAMMMMMMMMVMMMMMMMTTMMMGRHFPTRSQSFCALGQSSAVLVIFKFQVCLVSNLAFALKPKFLYEISRKTYRIILLVAENSYITRDNPNFLKQTLSSFILLMNPKSPSFVLIDLKSSSFVRSVSTSTA